MGLFKLIKFMFIKDKALKMKSIYDIRANIFIESLIIMLSILILCMIVKFKISIFIILDGFAIGQYFIFNSIVENNNKAYREYLRLRERAEREQQMFEVYKMQVLGQLRNLVDLLNKHNLRGGEVEHDISDFHNDIKHSTNRDELFYIDTEILSYRDRVVEYLRQKNNQQDHQKQPTQYDVYDKANFLRILELPSYIMDIQVVRKKWLELVKKYHPDKCKDGEERIKIINNAYDELKKILV